VFGAFNAVINAIASDAASAAGANPTIRCFDELWAFSSERSCCLWDEMVPPPTRRIACRLTVTYAGFCGKSLLLEELHKRGKALPQFGKDLYAGDGLLMFWSHEPIAPWQDEAWIASMRKTLRPSSLPSRTSTLADGSRSSGREGQGREKPHGGVSPASNPAKHSELLPQSLGHRMIAGGYSQASANVNREG
jgi:hypothetical protein